MVTSAQVERAASIWLGQRPAAASDRLRAVLEDFQKQGLFPLPAGMAEKDLSALAVWHDGKAKSWRSTRTTNAELARINNENAKQHEHSARAIRRLIELQALTHLRDGLVMAPVVEPLTHTFVPHPKYPWFCNECGYPPHEDLKHTQDTATREGDAK